MPESVSAQTRQRILRVAADEIRQHPVASVSMRDIAERAGVAKSSLYKAYANKYELFVDASQLVIGEKILEIVDHVADVDDPLEALRIILVDMLTIGRDDPYASAYLYGIFPLLYHGHVGDNILEQVDELHAQARARLENRIRAAIDAGDLPDDVPRLTELCLNAAFGYTVRWINDVRALEPQELADCTIAAMKAIR